MNLLLDTCTFLWIVRNRPELSETAKTLFQDENNRVFLSVVSVWEITVKNGLGRLPLADPPTIYIPRERERHNITSLELAEQDVLELEHLPPIHQDPFDRMLICQARTRSLVLLTPDQAIRAYPVASVW
ncbi:Type II toxin-antitoxin system VapC family toxin [Gammaproteobacteria bacterium]